MLHQRGECYLYCRALKRNRNVWFGQLLQLYLLTVFCCLCVCVLSSVSAGIIWQILITYNHGKAAESPGSETILPLCVCFFPPSLYKRRTCCTAWKDEKVNCFFIIRLRRLSLSAADRLAFPFWQNYLFLITNEHVWTCWHLAVNTRWSELCRKVKVREGTFFFPLFSNICTFPF